MHNSWAGLGLLGYNLSFGLSLVLFIIYFLIHD